MARNVLGGPLAECGRDPVTGFFRDGCCNTSDEDHGSHTVCTTVTARFLEFSRGAGNDLSTPRPEWGFPGLKPGDGWCVCAARWLEAALAVKPRLYAWRPPMSGPSRSCRSRCCEPTPSTPTTDGQAAATSRDVGPPVEDVGMAAKLARRGVRHEPDVGSHVAVPSDEVRPERRPRP
ncbi:MAG: DUF2237 domain-containing protein [Acidimicrobiales bacterium]